MKVAQDPECVLAYADTNAGACVFSIACPEAETIEKVFLVGSFRISYASEMMLPCSCYVHFQI